MRIRETSTPGNPTGRGGCQFRSPYSGQTYYATVEYGHVVLRDWGKRQLAWESEAVTVASGQLSAHYINEHEVCVTVASFHANTQDSAMETFVLTVEYGS